ncbi:conjugal transfer protein TraL [Vibrio mediterranei]
MKPKFFMAAIIAVFLMPSPPTYANDADCAIWLCLPTGFPSGCEEAKDAFKDRIKNFKSPLPSLPSCFVDTGEKTSSGNVTSTDGYAALIPETTKCVSWGQRRYDHEWHRYCSEHKTIPTHIIKGARCSQHRRDGKTISNPSGCSLTIRYVDTYVDGQAYGETYYFDRHGNQISLP